MATIRKTIIIGLGGTGASTVLNVKKTLLQFYGVIPHAVKTIVVETDNRLPEGKRYYGKDGRLQYVSIDRSEFLYMPVYDPENAKKANSIKSWWPDMIPVQAIYSGAHQYRAAGRMAFYANVRRLHDTIAHLVAQVQSVGLCKTMEDEQGLTMIETPGVEIYIIGSIAGGTGSGCFLDTAFLCRSLLPETTHKIIGFLILPHIFKELPCTQRVGINGYAALRELDHYMDYNYNMDNPTFVFGDKEFPAKRPPFDVVNLLDGRNEQGISLDGCGTSKGIENLCAITGMGIAINIGDMGLTAESARDNLYMAVRAHSKRDWEGKFPYYSTFGMAASIYPVEKHFNQLFSHFIFRLIDRILQQITEKESEEINEEALSNDILQFFTEKRLEENNDNILDDLLGTDRINSTTIEWVEDLKSSDDLKNYVDQAMKEKRDELAAELEQNYQHKKDEVDKLVRVALQQRGNKYSPAYALRFGEKLLAAFGRQIEADEKNFWSRRNDEIRNLEDGVRNERQDAEEFFTRDVRAGSGIRGKLFREWPKVCQGYIERMAELIKKQIDVDRRREALKIYELIADLFRQYEEGLNIGEMNRKLSEVRRTVETELFGSTVLKETFPIHSVMISPKEIIIKTKEGKRGEKVFSGSAQDYESLGCPVDVGDFLQKAGLSFEDLSRMNHVELRDKMVSYAQARLAFIKDITIEDVLAEGDDNDAQQKRLLKEQKELSHRSVPFWNHKAVADNASRMTEIFIIGVGDQSKSRFAKMRFPEAQYNPTFTSTGDSHKLFYFKYRAPLPAYLLADMDNYRNQYFSTPYLNNPHIEKEIELKSADLFPVTERDLWLNRLYILTLAVSLIKRDSGNAGLYYVDDPQILALSPGVDRVKLEKELWSVYEELKHPRREALIKKLEAIISEAIAADPQKVTSDLKQYHNGTKKRFTEKKESMVLGDEILLFEHIKILDGFFRSQVDIKKFLAVD